MDRVNGNNTVDIGGGRRGFKSQNAAAGIAGTEVTDKILNDLQEEICSVIESAGLVLNPENQHQLWDALLATVAPGFHNRTPWLPVISVTVSSPPSNPTLGDAYIIPTNATGVWAGKQQKLAEWSGAAWRIVDTKDGHGVGLPDGRVFKKVGGVYSGGRVRLSAPLIVHVSSAGNDSPERGLYDSSPFKTGTYAYSFIRDNYDLNGFDATIQLANGVHSQIICNGSLIGSRGAGSLTINGSNTLGAVSIAANANNQGLIAATGGAIININGIKLTAGSFTTCSGLYTTTAASTILATNIEFGSFPNGQHVLSQGQVQLTGLNTISGGAGQHLAATANGSIVVIGTTTLTGNPAFSYGFAHAQQNGSITALASAMTYSGGATGPRYVASMCGTINTASGNGNFFPGSTVGTTSTGGQFA